MSQENRASVVLPRSPDEWIATLAAMFFVYFAVAVLALQVLRTDYDPLSHFISDYAVGPFGEIMASAFMAISAGALFLFIGLVGLGPKTVLFRASLVPLAVFVPGIFVAALFPTDLPGAPTTTSGLIHNYDAMINFLSLIVATVLLSIGFGGDARWRPFRTRALLLAGGIVAAFATMIVTVNSDYGAAFGGLANKALATMLITWLIVVSLRLRGIARQKFRGHVTNSIDTNAAFL